MSRVLGLTSRALGVTRGVTLPLRLRVSLIVRTVGGANQKIQVFSQSCPTLLSLVVVPFPLAARVSNRGS
jgi:hypothetical protein